MQLLTTVRTKHNIRLSQKKLIKQKTNSMRKISFKLWLILKINIKLYSK